MKKNTTKLIYIVSDQRSGSTMLDMILANGHGVVSVGEMKLLSNYIQREGHGSSSDWKCTCGESIDDCDFWGKIISKHKQENVGVAIETDTSTKSDKKEILKVIFLSYFRLLAIYLDKNLKGLKVAENCWALYSLVSQMTDKSYILDSSKSPEQLYYIAKAAKDKKIKTIYIVRDSRGVSNSKLKWAKVFGKTKKLNLNKALLAWFLVNLKIKRILKSIDNIDTLRVNYEDLCENPKAVLLKICEFINIDYCDEMLLMDACDKHNIAGTPNIFSKKNDMIKKDESWRKNINKNKNVFQYYFGKVLNYLI